MSRLCQQPLLVLPIMLTPLGAGALLEGVHLCIRRTRRAHFSIVTAAALIAAFHASTAYATSCGLMRDRYVFSCEQQRCVGAFRVRDVRAFGACSRRPVVEDIDPQAADFLAPLIDASTDGVYTVTLRFRYWDHEENDGSLAWVLGRLADRLLPYKERDNTAELRNLQAVELRRRLDEQYFPSWLTREAADGGVQEARNVMGAEARRELAIDVVSWIVYWSSFVAVLLWFILSVHTYFRRLYEPAGTGPRRLKSPLLAQLVIGVLGVVPLFLDRVEFWPGTLLIPAVIVIFMVEGWARLRCRSPG